MMLIADMLLVAGALGAALYCAVLSRRLRRFTDLEKGVGGAVAVLSAQVDDLTQTLTQAQVAAKDSVGRFEDVNKRAEAARERLELLLATLHDLPQPAKTAEQTPGEMPFFLRRGAQAEVTS